MSLPQPRYGLTGHCSAIHDNTLYVFSAEGFQSLELTEGAQWQELEPGLGATGANCVKAVSGSTPADDAMFVVGGIPIRQVNEFTGIQRFSFATKKWSWIFPNDWVTQNRRNHASVYLNASQQILVYAGSQAEDATGDSSATFLIAAAEPHGVTAISSNAPPLLNPILLPFNESHAMMIGGNANNQRVFLFSPETQWQELPVQLPAAIANQRTTQAALVTGEDGSKVLETFDMGVSPNQVSRSVLINADGSVAQTGTTIGANDRNVKRVTLDSWPTYNNTYASTTTREDFSLATDGNGLAVISGGSAGEPVAIFDQQQNGWINSSALFAGEQIILQSEPSATPTPTLLSTPTSAPSAAATSETAVPAAAGGTTNKNRMFTVLGATLGTIFGLAALLVIALLLLRYKKEKKKRSENDYIEKDRLSFADRGDGFNGQERSRSMSRAISMAWEKHGNNPDPNHPMPWKQTHNRSNDSLAIISGRSPGGHRRGVGELGSDDSMAGLTKNPSPLGYSDAMEMSKLKEVSVGQMGAPSYNPHKRSLQGELNTVAAAQGPPEGASRSSGWSRYFAGNEATNLAQMESQRSTYASDRSSGNSESKYTGTESRLTGHPLAPLDLNFNKFEAQRLSQVQTGSPTLGHSREHLPSPAMKAQLARANSTSSSVSDIEELNGGTHWSPIGQPDWQRPVSSAYTDSNRGSAYPIQGDNGSSNASTFNPVSFYNGSISDENVNKHRDTTDPMYSQPPRFAPADTRDSTVTIFPRGVPSVTPAGAGAQQPGGKQSDMSWLNLGANNTS